MVESEGFEYLRLICDDHSFPREASIDQFIDFVKGLGEQKVWLHFHCCMGVGRTSQFMAIYDLMKNPGLSYEDYLLRQAMNKGSYLGSTDPLWEDEKGEGAEKAEKAEKGKGRRKADPRQRQLYDYIREMQTGLSHKTWSGWTLEKEREEAA